MVSRRAHWRRWGFTSGHRTGFQGLESCPPCGEANEGRSLPFVSTRPSFLENGIQPDVPRVCWTLGSGQAKWSLTDSVSSSLKLRPRRALLSGVQAWRTRVNRRRSACA